jgi:type II secretory pathway pseudopilin PulG
MKIQTTFVFGGALALLAPAHAQSPDAMQQIQNSQQQQQTGDLAQQTYSAGQDVPASYAGEVSDVGEQTVIAPGPRPTYFEAVADAQYLHTDNMFLSGYNKQSADELISTAEFSLAPTPYPLWHGSFAPRVGYINQWYNFGLTGDKTDGAFPEKLNNFDFTAEMPYIDMAWARNNWTFDAGFDFTSLISGQTGPEFYREYTPHWGVQKLLPFTGNSSLDIGYEGDVRFGVLNDPAALPVASDYNNRIDQDLMVAYTQKLCSHLMVQPYYSFQYTHFISGGVDRDDFLNTAGLSLYWMFTPQVSARIFASYAAMNTTAHGITDYNQLNEGFGLNLTFRF